MFLNYHHAKVTSVCCTLFLFLLLMSGCSPEKTLRGILKKQTPYERYLSRLKDAKLDQTAMGQQWISAGERALQTPATITLPFKETGYFPAAEPKATSYQFTVKRGQKVAVRVQSQGKEAPQLFVDLFEANASDPAKPNHVANADTTGSGFDYEIEEELPHILRVQPELLRSGQYTVTIETMPVLAFPVQGRDSRAIQSFWGADRDAGARRHEGIDIFAPRRTPVVASVDGTVTRVNTTPIGGKVVWLSDNKRRQSLYYAHLDSQLVQPGQRVQVGDTLGLLGNTGNARTTPPHLHFGIYRFGQGAVDPYPYVHQDRAKPSELQVDERHFGNWTRVARSNVTLRQAPSTSATALGTLPQHAPVKVLAGSGNWFKVELPDGQLGYVSGSLVEPLDKPLQTVRLRQQTPLLDASDSLAATKLTLPVDTTVRVLARYQDHLLVKNPAGETGWVANAALQ
ncbi:M23 family metallopeptidase [Rufibacter roseus]|uniref:Peptidoglycan DD-metalloendopeptidase family protein n=1 Tax=Rufibacter roseus TaxID=1567108 RepID=A0ABW2DM33_9BACT|nr:M23 family metallopeptidase [Rufibacter roseus]